MSGTMRSKAEPWFVNSAQAARPLFSGGDGAQRSWLSDLQGHAPDLQGLTPQSVAPPAAAATPMSPPSPASGSNAVPAVSQAASAAFVAAAARLDALRDQVLEGARQQMIELALQIARRVVGDHVSRVDVDIQPLLAQAVSQVADGVQATVRVHPSCCHMVEAWMVQAPVRAVRVVADPSLQAGDVVVESDGGNVDGRLAPRLARAEADVRRALEVDGAAA